MNRLALAFPVAFVACDVEQVLVGIDVLLSHELCCIGYYLFRNTNLACYFDGKATSGIAYLQLEKSSHLLSVVEHCAVHDS